MTEYPPCRLNLVYNDNVSLISFDCTVRPTIIRPTIISCFV